MAGKPSGRGYVKKLKEENIPSSGPSLKYQFSNEYWNRMARVAKRMGVPTTKFNPFGGYTPGQGVSVNYRKQFKQDPEGARLLGKSTSTMASLKRFFKAANPPKGNWFKELRKDQDEFKKKYRRD